GRGRASLHGCAVEVERKVELLWIWNLIPGDEPRAERPERVIALCLDPFAGAALLQAPLRDIVANAIARNEVEGVLSRDVLGAAADHDRKLDLEIHAVEALWLKHRVVGSGDAGACLGEHDGNLWARHTGLLGMVPVV